MSERPRPIAEAPAEAQPAAPEVHTPTSRRTLLRAAGLVALTGGSAAALAACTADAEVAAPSAPSPSSPSAAASSSPSASAATSPSAPASSSAPPAPSGPSVATAKVPVGGGVILDDADYVITQPTKGEFKAFSKTCTHMGCPVAKVADGVIKCDCHGSAFSIKDGSVTSKPADKPLKETPTTVSGDNVYVDA